MADLSESFPFFPGLSGDNLLNLMKLRTVEADGADAAVDLIIDDRVTNHIGALQGGIAAILVDVAAGAAVAKRLDPSRIVATQDLVIRYLAPVRPPAARASAVVIRAGRSSIVVDVRVQERCAGGRMGVAASACFSVLADPE